ncbi:MAG: DNA repair protein RadA [Clostridia bacterium]|nr:DNA repair protein RadA [Clostridia bacterium]
MKSKTEFVCSECGNVTSKWFGKCQACGTWNSIEEHIIENEPAFTRRDSSAAGSHKEPVSKPINMINYDDAQRVKTGMNEFDRVLGGGIVEGSVTLLSGEPGVGKSTLLLQVCGLLGDSQKLLYVTGEESCSQIKLRARRLGIESDKILIYSETDIGEIISEADAVNPDIIVIDSIQTLTDESSSTAPGSITQVRTTASKLIKLAKSGGISVIIVGHVNKDGGIAGPKILEHMVDTVLYFDGEKQYSYRTLRAVKNRFGSTNEIGMFEMDSEGLCEVENPSEYLLSQRPLNVSGSCTLCVMEGTRPILAEVQALVTKTAYPVPKRVSAGFDYNRLMLLSAVLEKRLGLNLSTSDVFVNIVGGLRVDDPSCDLATCVAIISGLRDIIVDNKLLAVGEVGLAGECRAVGNIEQRIREAARLGFSTVLIPMRNYERSKGRLNQFDGKIRIVPVRSIFDCINYIGRKDNE